VLVLIVVGAGLQWFGVFLVFWDIGTTKRLLHIPTFRTRLLMWIKRRRTSRIGLAAVGIGTLHLQGSGHVLVTDSGSIEERLSAHWHRLDDLERRLYEVANRQEAGEANLRKQLQDAVRKAESDLENLRIQVHRLETEPLRWRARGAKVILVGIGVSTVGAVLAVR